MYGGKESAQRVQRRRIGKGTESEARRRMGLDQWEERVGRKKMLRLQHLDF